MERIPRAIYTRELREEAVKLVTEGGGKFAMPPLKLRNATDLFEARYAGRVWPASSERFWTSVFALFLIQTPNAIIRIWHSTRSGSAPWYQPRIERSKIALSSLNFESLAVEPRSLQSWPLLGSKVPPKIGGFSPDIVLAYAETPKRFAVIENKITYGAYLSKPQSDNYPNLVEWLADRGIDCEFLLLQSAGSKDTLYDQAGRLQERLRHKFGIILWEQVLIAMAENAFHMRGLELSSYMADFHEVLRSHVVTGHN